VFLVRRFVVQSPTGYLQSTDCFGAGELNRRTVYKTPKNQSVEFIVVPRDAFESRMTLRHQLHMLSDRLDHNRQTSPEVYRSVDSVTLTSN